MERFRKSEKGFTLIELLIVVAIIGILAAIAIPQFTKYKKNASKSACNADLKICVSDAAARYAHNGSDNNQTCEGVGGSIFNELATKPKFNVLENGIVRMEDTGSINADFFGEAFGYKDLLIYNPDKDADTGRLECRFTDDAEPEGDVTAIP